MRFAVISDVQANLSALRAVLAAIDEIEPAVDRVVCAGDLVGRGPQPNEVIDMLREREIEAVRGNYDDAVAYDRLGSGVDFGDEHAEQVDRMAVHWTRGTLTEENLSFVRALPRDVRLFPALYGVGVRRDDLQRRLGDERRSLLARTLFGNLARRPASRVKQVLVVHGSPRSYHEHVRPDTANSILEVIAREAKTDLLVSGHSGVGFERTVAGMTFIGVASMSGLDAVPGHADYALIEVTDQPRVEFRSALYDPAEQAQAIWTSGLPSELAARFSV